MSQYIYQHLADKLRERISSGAWNPNDRLPSIRSLAESFNVSKITVQNALHKLEATGLINAKPRSGYFVSVREAKLALNKNDTRAENTPKLVNVPDIFHEIMQRSAAFDLAPTAPVAQCSSHIQLLNRHMTRATRKHANRNTVYYGNPNGHAMLREQLAKHYKLRKLRVNDNEICITAGCQNSLYLALSACCKSGDVVAIESPAFYGVLQLIQALQLQVVEIPSSYTLGLRSDDVKKLLKKWKIKACVVTPNYSTPTGACMPLADKKSLYQLSVDYDFTLIEDDIYGDLGFHFTPEPIKSFDKTGNVILCSSVSKSLSRDLRVGWIMGGKFHDSITHNKLIHQLSGSQSTQEGVATYMAEGEYRRHLLHYRSALKAQRDQLIETINAHWHFSFNYTVPDGGLSLWIELDPRINAVELYNRALAHNITLTPGRLFSSSNNYSNFIRLSFVHAIDTQRLQAIKKVNELVHRF